MIRVAIVLSLISLAAAAPAKEEVSLLENNFVRDDHGQYSYNFLTGNGVARTEQGALVPNKVSNYLAMVF